MDESYILAVDLGTTNCKTILLTPSCQIARKKTVEYSVSVPKPGWSEQDPADWWEATRQSIREILQGIHPETIKAIGLSGQMHGLVLLDERERVLRPAILWNDQRSFEECQEIYARAGGSDRMLSFTNNAMLPGYTGGKILWVKKNEPETFSRISHFLLPKDFIRHRLTGLIGTDVSDASGTGLFDVRKRRWATELIELLGFPPSWFPSAYESSHVAGEVRAEIATELGLSAHTPVIVGGGDAVMQAVGSNVTSPEKVLLVVGTGGNVTVSEEECMDNPGGRLQSFCHVLPEMWVSMGAPLAAGSSLKWFRDALGGPERSLAAELAVSPYQILSEIASKSPPGSGGVVFLPYLQGERCPHVDVYATGTYIGLRLTTQKCDMVRGVMEGVAFSLRDVFELINQTGAHPEVVHLSGGGSASSVWRQIFADVLNRQVRTLDYSEDAGAVGAAVIAGLATGIWSSCQQAVERIPVQTINDPITGNIKLYNNRFEVYQEVYPALRSIYEKLARTL